MKKHIAKLLKDESAQGATEYILLLVAVVGLLALFRGQITQQVENMIGKLGEQINLFNNQ